MNDKLTRAIVGAIPATLTMTVAFLGAHRLNRRAPPPPETLVASMLRYFDVKLAPAGSVPEVVWLIPHFSYGLLVAPTAYRATRRFLPHDDLVAGVLFSEIDWAVDYLLLWPALGLYPWPHKDNWPRAVTNLLGHAVYGAVLGKAARISR